MASTSLLARLASSALPLVVAALSPLVVACTGGYLDAEALPTSDVPSAELFEFLVEGERTSLPAPPLLGARLLAAHPDQAHFAVSDGRRLWLSEGEGLRELPLSAAGVEHMVMDEAGVLWLLRADGRLSSVDEEGDLHDAAPLPLRAAKLFAGAGHLVIFGAPVEGEVLPRPSSADHDYDYDVDVGMAISHDAQTWELRRRPWDGSEFDDLAIDARGRMWLMDGDELSCGGGGQERWTGRLDRRGWKHAEWDYDYPGSRVAATGGWTYVHGDCGEASLCAVTPGGELVRVLDAEHGRYAIAHREGTTMVVTTAGSFEVEGRRASRVGDGLPELSRVWSPPMVISAGRAVIATDQSVWIGDVEGWAELALEA